MKKFSSKLLSVITAFVIIFVPVTNVAAEQTSNEFVILHTNDVHGQIDPAVNELALLKTYKDKVDATFIFDAGDASQGLPLNNITQGARLAEIYNAIGYDGMTLGNHEFDFSRDAVLAKEDGFFKSANFPIIATNIYFNEDAEAGEVPNTAVFETGEVLTENINGEDYTFSILGVTTPETKVKADPRNSAGMDFRDPLPEIKKELENPMHKETDYIIVLSHLGVDLETQENWRGNYLAEELSKDSDLKDRKIIVIDGHSHTEFENGKKYGDNVLYGQTGGTLGTFGEMTINLDDFSASTAKTVKVRDGYELDAGMLDLIPDPVVKGIIDEAAAEFDEKAGYAVLENLPIDLNGERDFVRTRETNLGNLIADSMYEYGLEYFKDSDFAVMNGGGIRASLKPGVVTFKDILTVLPYGNRIVQIDVKGTDVLAMYEHALKAAIVEDEVDSNGLPLLQSDPAILHSSDSIKVRFDTNLQSGSRVLDIHVKNNEGIFEKLDHEKVYKLVTLEFLAVGGDGFTMLGGARREGANDADAFAEYLTRDIDWSKYDDAVRSRIVPAQLATEEHQKMLEEKVKEAVLYLENESKYTVDSFARLKLATDALAEGLRTFNAELDNTLMPLSIEDVNTLISNFDEAVEGLEIYVEVPVKPTPPTDNTDKEPVAPTPKPKPDVDTGIASSNKGIYLSLLTAAVAGSGYVALRKRKED